MLLNVRIYKQYFDAILKGVKTTEYRTMSDYWMRKLVDVSKYGKDITTEQDLRTAIQDDAKPTFRDYDRIRFFCGKQTATYKIVCIRVYPHHDWFAIKLGERLE